MELPTFSGRALHSRGSVDSCRASWAPASSCRRRLCPSRHNVVPCSAVATGPSSREAVQGTPPKQHAGSNGANGSVARNARPAPPKDAYVPDDFVLAPGEVSHVDRVSSPPPGEVFRCPGCTEPACQGPKGCAPTQWRFEPDGYLRQILTARVYDVAVQTPLEKASRLSDALGNTVLLKREDLQPVFSFKLRGAYNKMAKLSKQALAAGVITSSAGNHAQGVALSASRLGARAVICMPTSTPEIKVDNVKRLGGIVELVGDSYQETQAYALERAVAEGLTFVHPFDDPYTIAGQGTIGAEIWRQLSDPEALDAIFVAVGGGGLAAGIAAYIKSLRPEVKVYGVEPTGANAMAMSLAWGERIRLSKVDAFADGVAVKQVGMETFRLSQRLLDGVLLVSNAEISAAIKDVFNETRCILEPAGGVAVAGAKAWLTQNGHKGKTVVAVTSGANINFERLRLVADMADVGARTELMMATTIPETPGAFKAFIETASSASASISVTEFNYRFNAGEQAQILWSASVRSGLAEQRQLLDCLNAAGFQTLDLSGMELAQTHLRHLAGGRARSYTGSIQYERLLQVTFPERPGALKRFLDALSPTFNITLFHYRRTGATDANVLCGMQVSPAQEEAFAQKVAQLQGDFAFTQLSQEDQRAFDLFLK